MNFKTARLAAWCAALLLSAIRSVAADAGPPDEIRQPHTPTLIFYLTGVTGQPDFDVITASGQLIGRLRFTVTP